MARARSVLDRMIQAMNRGEPVRLCPSDNGAFVSLQRDRKSEGFTATAGRLYGGIDGAGTFLAAGAIALELGCGVALILGLFARQAAVALFLFTIAATLMFHNFGLPPRRKPSHRPSTS